MHKTCQAFHYTKYTNSWTVFPPSRQFLRLLQDQHRALERCGWDGNLLPGDGQISNEKNNYIRIRRCKVKDLSPESVHMSIKNLQIVLLFWLTSQARCQIRRASGKGLWKIITFARHMKSYCKWVVLSPKKQFLWYRLAMVGSNGLHNSWN